MGVAVTAPRFSLLLDGVDASCYTLAAVRVIVGRESVWEQAAAGTMTVRLRAASVAGQTGVIGLDALAELWVSTTVLPAAAAAGDQWEGSPWDVPDWRLFAGRVTDVAAERDDTDMWILTLTMAGTLAELARFDIGDTPWPVEPEADRLTRILTVAGYDTSGIPPLTGPDMIARDIDKQQPLRLLREVADSGGGLLWEDHTRVDSTTGGALVAYQPLVLRTITGLVLWDQSADTWDTIAGAWDDEVSDTVTAPWIIDPCRVSADDWTWDARIGDLVTFAEIEYGGNDPATSATSGTLTPPVYKKRLTSQLNDLADAQTLADRIVLGRGAPRWSTETAMLDIARIPLDEYRYLPNRLVAGRAVTIAALPAGSPVNTFVGFLEGWEHEISIEDRALSWWVRLFITDASMTAPMTTWDQTDPLTWDGVDPAAIWDQLLLSP